MILTPLKDIQKTGLFLLFGFIVFTLGMSACSLFSDDDEPQIFYEFKDFDILNLGKNITDMRMDPQQPYLYLADYGNNTVLRIDVSGVMRIDKKIIVGSHPIALDFAFEKTKLLVALSGESSIKLIDLATFIVEDAFPVSLNEINDLACVLNGQVLISSLDEPTISSLNLADKIETVIGIRSGEMIASADQQSVLVASPTLVRKYALNNGSATQQARSTTFGFEAQINHFVVSDDGATAFLCLADPMDHSRGKNVWAFNTADLTLKGKFEAKSAGMGVAVSPDGKRVFVAPTDADGAGVFVIEFDGETKLEKNYYLVAGNLKARGIVIDNSDQYLYVIVNTPGDNDSFEPYNNNSYDLQRIAIDEP